jgi:chlorophyll synthase
LKFPQPILKLVDVLFLVRPPLLCASSTFFFLGALAARRAGGTSSALALLAGTIPNLILFFLVTSAAFIVNQLSDVESDSLNRKTFLLPSGVVSKRAGVLFLVVVLALALLLSLRSEGTVRNLVWIGLLLGLAYSIPPVRLKGKPVLDLLANVVGFAVIGFALGWLALRGAGPMLYVRAVPYALALSAVFLNTCIPDEEGDRAVGDRTSCVVFGSRAVAKAALVLLVASGLAGILTDEILCTLAISASLPAFIAVAIEPDPATSVVASQIAARLLLILVCIKAPLLAILTVATFAASKAFFRKRFGLAYPEIRGARKINTGKV